MENKLTSFLFNRIGIGNYQKFLDISSFRHKLTAANVANVSTPGFESKDIDFKAELAKIGDRSNHLAGTITHSSHIPTGHHSNRAPKVHSDKIHDGDMNSVDIDREVPKMAQNELQYTIAARLLERKFSGLKKVISSR
ncbi:MAG: flagellar basal body rod protein FlgB [Candidatus Zixiibacteriota bacterium]|nr:MAG: flagellar basal body rod protein FlgB [candidate division Zixibacteria bacterium]